MKNVEEKIIEIAKPILLQKGVQKVSVEEICKSAGISKKTYYVHYKNKIELIKVILKEFMDEEIKIFHSIKNLEISFKDKIIRMTEKKMEKFSSAESIFLKDVLENCQELQPYVFEQIKESERELFLFVSEEQMKNNLRSDIPASFITYMLTTKAMEMFLDPQIEKIFPDLNERVEVLLDCLLNGLDK